MVPVRHRNHDHNVFSLCWQLVSGPDHGQLFMVASPEEVVSSWNQETLETGNLLYRQLSDGESTSDRFVFTVSDG